MSLLTPSPLSLDDQVAALRTRAGARELDDRLLAVRGSDRASWLAGMVTQDVKDLRPGQSTYAAVVHVKGKIIADAWLHARAEDVLLAVHPRAVEPLRAHFEQHIIMEDVEVEPMPADARVVAVQGPAARALLENTPPLGVFDADRIGWSGVDCVVASAADAEALRAALARAEVPAVSDAAWDAARLEAGVPRFGVDFDEDNYVQEAAITPRAVSFSKGCYVGQEVVCRLEMRGHVRRQLVPLTIEGGEPPAAGTPVVRGGAEVGAVTSAARSPALGRVVALAMVKWDVARGGGAVEVAGRAAEIVAQPVA